MEVRHDEANARVQLAVVPLHLRDDSPRPVPALRLVVEARVEASDITTPRGRLTQPAHRLIKDQAHQRADDGHVE